jgi:hypothetical protein
VNHTVNHEDPHVQEQIRQLRELIAALDQRVPHIERIGEADIASDAAALKQRAEDRLRKLEMATPGPVVD